MTRLASYKKSPSFRGEARRHQSRVEVLPLIDVMFLLVAFFVVVSISRVAQKGIFVDLTSAQTGVKAVEKPKDLVVSVKADGQLYFAKERVEKEELLLRLRAIAQTDKDTRVTVNADKQSRHEHVVEVLDAVRQTSLHNIMFAVEPAAAHSPEHTSD